MRLPLTPENKERLILLRKVYETMLDREEEMGWPGDSPFWEARQYIKQILDNYNDEL
jgi:hypothetical protein